MGNTNVGEDSASPHLADKSVRRLDQLPELVQALREGDLMTGRLFWPGCSIPMGGVTPETTAQNPEPLR
jgi:hypothetical protein